MTKISDDPNELFRRHRTAMLVVVGFLLLTFALLAVAYFAEKSIVRPGDPSIVMGLRTAMVIFGLGVFVFRRTRFAAMRLRDIVAVKGRSALLKTLQGTTIQCASIGGAIALMGFIITIRTGDWIDMLRGGGVAVVVLIYCFPFRGAWQRAVIQFSREI
jgi:hypothetical protein